MKYRLIEGKKHYLNGRRLEAGAEVELTDAQYAGLADRFESFSGSPAATVPEPTGKPAGVAELGLADVNMPDAIDKVSKLGTAEALDAAAAEEKAGKDRKGVFQAIDDRRAELEG